ncbi:MAG: hypothetical protein ACJ754_28755 [Pyrinomonadaceae bacterium]
MKRCLTALLFVLLAAGAVAAQTARIGREFELKAGRVVTLDGGRLRIRFARVESDSRCPVDVTCVWAGNAELLFEVGARSWKGKTTLKPNTNASPERPGEFKYDRYTLKLVGLSPRPRSNQKIKPGQYTATLLVSKE